MRFWKGSFPAFAVLAVATAATAGDSQSMQAVAELDLERYAGRWFEIARLPNRFQKDCTANVTATYELRSDGRINVVNRCETNEAVIEVRGEARRDDDELHPARLRVRFAPGFLSWLPFVWGKYWVLALDQDYQYSLVGEPGLEYLWILSRAPRMSEDDYQQLITRAGDVGYDISKIQRTRQLESEERRPVRPIGRTESDIVKRKCRPSRSVRTTF